MARERRRRHLHADQGRVDREARRRRLADPWQARRRAAVTSDAFTLDAGERDARGGVAELAPRFCCAPRCTGSQGLAGAGHGIQRQRRFLRPRLQRRLRRRTCSVIGQATPRRPATRRRPDRTSWASCATTAALPDDSASRSRTSPSRARMSTRAKAAFARAARARTRHRQRGRAARSALLARFRHRPAARSATAR